MNHIDSELLRDSNAQAIYNIYLYLADKTTPQERESLRSIVAGLEAAKNRNPGDWKARDIYRLNILRNAIANNIVPADSRISDLTRSKGGMTACAFTQPDSSVSVAFRGTGSGEWIDNGEGLSGIPEENTYIIYNSEGEAAHSQTVQNDYATDQQVEALNWFNRAAAKNGWDSLTRVTVSGHSKGGNKAQFVAIHSDLVDACFSFDGQGFSPEALAALEKQYGSKYQERRARIRSFSADNDYVNVLGERLAPPENIYYFKSHAGIHHLEAILDKAGRLRPQSEQGKLSAYMQAVSQELMGMPPAIRQYATLGVMNIFQRYLGEGVPVNGDSVSVEKTVAGIGIAVGSLLNRLRKINRAGQSLS